MLAPKIDQPDKVPQQDDITSGPWVLTAVAIAVVTLYYAYPNAVPDYRADQAHDPFTYISLAKALTAGHGYHVKHWHPGFPLLMAAALAVCGLDFFRLKLMMITLGLLAGLASWRFFLGCGLRRAAPWLALLFATIPLEFDYSHRLMSEIPFAAFMILALVGFCNLLQAHTVRRIWKAAALLIIAAPAALVVRGNALALMPSLAVAIVILRGPVRQLKRTCVATALLLMLAVYVGWTIWGARHRFDGIANVTYLEELRAADLDELWKAGGLGPGVARVSASAFGRRMYQNLVWHQLYNVDALLWPGADELSQLPRLGFFLAILGLVPAVIGSVLLARRCLPLGLYVFFSAAMVVVYPTGGAARMILPSVPVLILTFYLGLECVIGEERAVGWLACAVFANLAICAVQADVQSRRPYYGESTADVIAMSLQDVPREVRPDDVVITDYYLVVAALADRDAVRPADLSAMTRRPGAEYLLETQDHPVALPTDLARRPVLTRGGARLSRLIAAR